MNQNEIKFKYNLILDDRGIDAEEYNEINKYLLPLIQTVFESRTQVFRLRFVGAKQGTPLKYCRT